MTALDVAQPLRAHAKPYDTHRDAERRPTTRAPRHARTAAASTLKPLLFGPGSWEPTRGRHAHLYNHAYEQLQIELGIGTSAGKHAKSAPAGVAR